MSDLAKQNVALGAISAVLASIAFSFNDMAIKWVSGDYSLYQVVFIRASVGLLFILAVIMPLNGGVRIFRTRRLGMHILRGMCVVFANLTFFVGLSVLNLADAVAVFFVSPLVITAFGVLFLGERAGPRRWGAVIAGLIGVIIMVRPGTSAFQVAMLLPLVAAVGYALLHILTRKIGGTESAATMIVYIQLTFLAVSGLNGVFFGNGWALDKVPELWGFAFRPWIWPDPSDYLILVMIGVASTAGGYFISQAYRLAEASVIAPMEYIAMPMAVIYGFFVFGEWPEARTWIGIALIIGAGLFVYWREAVLGSRKSLESRRLHR